MLAASRLQSLLLRYVAKGQARLQERLYNTRGMASNNPFSFLRDTRGGNSAAADPAGTAGGGTKGGSAWGKARADNESVTTGTVGLSHQANGEDDGDGGGWETLTRCTPKRTVTQAPVGEFIYSRDTLLQLRPTATTLRDDMLLLQYTATTACLNPVLEDETQIRDFEEVCSCANALLFTFPPPSVLRTAAPATASSRHRH